MDITGLPSRLAGRQQGGQAMAEARMTDTFAVYSPTDKITTKDADGFDSDVWAPRGEVQGYVQGQGRDTETVYADVSGIARPVPHARLHIPIAAEKPAAGDRGRGWEYVCTAVGPSSDPALVGTRWLVWECPVKSAATARRLTVVEVTDGRAG